MESSLNILRMDLTLAPTHDLSHGGAQLITMDGRLLKYLQPASLTNLNEAP